VKVSKENRIECGVLEALGDYRCDSGMSFESVSVEKKKSVAQVSFRNIFMDSELKREDYGVDKKKSVAQVSFRTYSWTQNLKGKITVSLKKKTLLCLLDQFIRFRFEIRRLRLQFLSG
jgi:hypothetical protein